MCTNPRGATHATAAPLPAPAEDDLDDDDEPEVVAPPTRKRKHSQQWTCGACTFVNEGGRTCDVCGAFAGKDQRPFPVCGGCDARRYCGEACQIADWEAGHARKCEMSVDWQEILDALADDEV